MAEIKISDGIKDLEYYSKSKLLRKDDRYFYSGMDNIKQGIGWIIKSLQAPKKRLKDKCAETNASLTRCKLWQRQQ